MADPNTVGVGHKTYMGIGEETTYGTPVARTKYIEINSESLVTDQQWIRSGSLYRRGHLTGRRTLGRRVCGGDFEFELAVEDCEKILKHAFGASASSQPDATNAATAYAHDFTMADSLPTGLSLEVFRDTEDFGSSANFAFLYEGCQVNSLAFSLDAEGLLMARTSVIAEDENKVAKSTESIADSNIFAFANASLTVDGVEVNCQSCEVTVNNNIGPRNHLGTRLTRQPRPTGNREVGGRATIEFDDWEQYEAYRAGTILQFQLETQGANIGGSVDELFQIILPKCVYTSFPIQTRDVGALTVDVEWQADLQATVGEALCTIINTNTTV